MLVGLEQEDSGRIKTLTSGAKPASSKPAFSALGEPAAPSGPGSLRQAFSAWRALAPESGDQSPWGSGQEAQTRCRL